MRLFRRSFDVRRAILDRAGARAYVEAGPLFLYPPPWLRDNLEASAAGVAAAAADMTSLEIVHSRIEAIRAFDLSTRLHTVTARTSGHVQSIVGLLL